MNTVALCLWLDGRAEEAADFYLHAFSSALGEHTAVRLGTRPLAEDRVPAISLLLAGQQFRLLKGTPAVGHNGTAVVVLEALDEREALAAALGDGAEILPSGWLIDRFGTAWLVTSPHTSARYAVIDSPLGPLTLVVDRELLVGIWFEDHRGRPPAEDLGVRIDVADDPVLTATVAQIEEYFAGTRTEFDLPLGLSGGTFETHVWRATQGIALGETMTYGEVAHLMRDPRAAQAAGGAIGRNPISIVIPCHRVVSADGDLTGYAGGLLRKQWMLDHEAFVAGHILFDAPAAGHLAYTDPEVAAEVRAGLGILAPPKESAGLSGTAGAARDEKPAGGRARTATTGNRLPEDVPLLSEWGEVAEDAAAAPRSSEPPEPAVLRLPRHGAFASETEVLLDTFPAGTPVRLDATLQLRGAGVAEIVARHQPRDAYGAPAGPGTEHVLRLTAPADGPGELVLDRSGATEQSPLSATVPSRRAGAAAVADLALTIAAGRLDVTIDQEHTLTQDAPAADADLEVLLRAQGAPARLGPTD